MRVRSVAQVKGIPQASSQPAPRTGTRLRDAFDLLRNNAGKPVAAPSHSIITQLQDYYGFDLQRSGDFGEDRMVTLVGEYAGDHYHDYINNRVVHQCDL